MCKTHPSCYAPFISLLTLNIKSIVYLWWTLATFELSLLGGKKKHVRRKSVNDMPLPVSSSLEEVKISLLKGRIQSLEHEKGGRMKCRHCSVKREMGDERSWCLTLV